jgi:hypothetical protein
VAIFAAIQPDSLLITGSVRLFSAGSRGRAAASLLQDVLSTGYQGPRAKYVAADLFVKAEIGLSMLRDRHDPVFLQRGQCHSENGDLATQGFQLRGAFLELGNALPLLVKTLPLFFEP